MKTLFMLMAQYDGLVIIPMDRVRADYFSHLTREKFAHKLGTGAIPIPLVRMEASQKSARGIHVDDLAKYLDAQRAAAQRELQAMVA